MPQSSLRLGPVKSVETRKRLWFSSHSFGPRPAETLDVFSAASVNAPVAIFIHGGAWTAISKEDVSYVAEAFVSAGVHCVILNFDTIPEVRMPDMTDEIRRGIMWTHENATSFGGDPGRLHVLGHSSGAHLTSVMLTTDWTTHGMPARLFRSALVCSGIYDLKAPMLSARSKYARLTQVEEQALSAMRHLDMVHCPIIIGFGDKESPEFQRQGRDFASVLKHAGLKHELHVGSGLNHFEVMHSISEPNGFFRNLANRLLELRWD